MNTTDEITISKATVRIFNCFLVYQQNVITLNKIPNCLQSKECNHHFGATWCDVVTCQLFLALTAFLKHFCLRILKFACPLH